MPSDHRRLTDPRELRALSHPTRLALLELLDTEGPMTATQAGERLGESPASASFHLRTLARYGFVQEAEGGRGRQRPWRIAAETQEIRPEDLGPEGRIAADAFLQLLRQRDIERLAAWSTSRQHYPERWRRAARELRLSVHLTADELAGFAAAVTAALAPYVDRETTGERPPGALPISVGLHAVPMRPPAAEGPTTEDSVAEDLTTEDPTTAEEQS